MCDGANDGLSVVGGLVVGTPVGRTVGMAVGASVGRRVGLAVGTIVGAAVGAAVGALLGRWVGTAVGAIVGTAVGARVGVALGASVTVMAVARVHNESLTRAIAGLRLRPSKAGTWRAGTHRFGCIVVVLTAGPTSTPIVLTRFALI